MENKFHYKICLTEPNFRVKNFLQYIGFPYTFLESTNIIEQCPEHDFSWSEPQNPLDLHELQKIRTIVPSGM